jgi:hypothetical protein
MHYEIEQAGAGDEHRPDVGTHAEPERWHAVNIFDADVVPTPLTFDTIDQALAYVARTPGTLRIGFCQRSRQQVSPVPSRSRCVVKRLRGCPARPRSSGEEAVCGDRRERAGEGGNGDAGSFGVRRDFGRTGRPISGT